MVLCPETDRHAGEHSRTDTLVIVVDFDFDRECACIRIDSRVNQADFPFEYFVSVYIQPDVDIFPLFYFCEEAFGYVDQQFDRTDLFNGEDRRASAILIAGGDDTGDRTQ